jgi:hypothetical protein
VNTFHKQWQTFSLIKNGNEFLSNIYHFAAARICSIPLHQIQHDEKHIALIREELAYWDTTFNAHYVNFIETKLFAAYSGGPLLTDDYFEIRKKT